jgi:hypothetical protein
MSRTFDPESGGGQGPAADLWRHTVARVPTAFGRLVYLASLRKPDGGEYEHHSLAQMCGEEQAVETLRRSHAEVFREWLCLTLEQQTADLEGYLSELPGSPRATLITWQEAAPYRNWIPASAEEVERQLYLTDLENVLRILRHAYGVA